MHLYVLDEHGNPKQVSNLTIWAKLFESQDRILTRDEVSGALVSTIFLGCDHSQSKDREPILWETMIFGGEHDQFLTRYTTREEALAGHADAVKMVSQTK